MTLPAKIRSNRRGVALDKSQSCLVAAKIRALGNSDLKASSCSICGERSKIFRMVLSRDASRTNRCVAVRSSGTMSTTSSRGSWSGRTDVRYLDSAGWKTIVSANTLLEPPSLRHGCETTKPQSIVLSTSNNITVRWHGLPRWFLIARAFPSQTGRSRNSHQGRIVTS